MRLVSPLPKGWFPVKCTVCDSEAVVFDPEMNLYRCDRCGHTFTKLPQDAREKFGAEYYEDSHKNWFDHPNIPLFARAAAAVEKYRGAQAVALLDVGCGRGDFLKWLHAKRPNWKLTGLDLSPNDLGDIPFIQGDVFDAQLKDKYDVITMFSLIAHLEDNRPFFARMRTLLNDGGILVINTFNTDSLIFRIARTLKKFGLVSPFQRLYSHHHLQHYSKKSIREVLVRSGFEIVEHQCHNYPVQAVDVPRSNKLVESLFRGFAGLIFLVSDPIGLGVEHTVVCRPAP